MKNKLKEVIISVTNRCNLRCAMCQIPESETNELSTAELKGLISDAARLHPDSIVFSGGEPLMRKDIFELIDFTNKLRINSCFASNGTLISKAVAKQLSSLGVGVVNISIEGPQHIHDVLRGEGNFKKSIEALKNLLDCKIETTIATIVCKQNYKYLPYVVNLAHEFGATTVKFQPFNALFLKKRDVSGNFFASPEAIKEIQQSIEKVIKLTKKFRISTNPLNYLYAIPIYLTGLLGEHPVYDCAAIWASCPISAEGSVYLCWAMTESPIGNVKNEKIYDIWNSSLHNRLRGLVSEKSCPGCLMSCYDYNLGKYDFREILSIKLKKLNKRKFYKRQFNRIYQYSKYIMRKILNKIANSDIFYKKDIKKQYTDIKKEIKLSRNILKKAIEKF